MRVRVLLSGGSRLLGYASPVLVCALGVNVYAQHKIVETQYLECVRDNKGRDVASRSTETSIFDSKLGFRAYGVVVASNSPEGACTNTSTIYLAEPGGPFQVALQQTSERLPDGSIYDGNGIESIQWSPSGARLLIGISQWMWRTDSTWHTKYLVLTPSEGGTREIRLAAGIERYFSQPCTRLVSSEGWLDDRRIGIEIKAADYMDEDGVADPTPSCVRRPTRFSFDVDSGKLIERR